MKIRTSLFFIGQRIHHKRYNYRGVIVDVDPEYAGSEEWYRQVALSRPPKDKPWYRVLVHNATHMTYVAERNLEADDSDEPIIHPMRDEYFDTYENGVYSRSGMKQ